MEERLKLITQTIGVERFKWQEKLKAYTFSKSEGVAECFYIVTLQRELIQILEICHDLKVPYFLFGSGTKILLTNKVPGLVIKNRTSGIKVAGVKGKVSKDGINMEQAMIEADSGISLKKLNEFVTDQKLQSIDGFSSLNSTVGGAIFLDPLLRGATQSLKVWDDDEVTEIKLDELKRSMVVLSVIFRFKASE